MADHEIYKVYSGLTTEDFLQKLNDNIENLYGEDFGANNSIATDINISELDALLGRIPDSNRYIPAQIDSADPTAMSAINDLYRRVGADSIITSPPFPNTNFYPIYQYLKDLYNKRSQDQTKINKLKKYVITEKPTDDIWIKPRIVACGTINIRSGFITNNPTANPNNITIAVSGTCDDKTGVYDTITAKNSENLSLSQYDYVVAYNFTWPNSQNLSGWVVHQKASTAANLTNDSTRNRRWQYAPIKYYFYSNKTFRFYINTAMSPWLHFVYDKTTGLAHTDEDKYAELFIDGYALAAQLKARNVMNITGLNPYHAQVTFKGGNNMNMLRGVNFDDSPGTSHPGFNYVLRMGFASLLIPPEGKEYTDSLDGYLWYNCKTIFGKDKPKTVFSNSPGVMTYIEGHWDGTMMGDYGYLLDNPGINSGWSNITE